MSIDADQIRRETLQEVEADLKKLSASVSLSGARLMKPSELNYWRGYQLGIAMAANSVRDKIDGLPRVPRRMPLPR